MPLFNPDLEGELPHAVGHSRATISASDALIVAGPEYAHGISDARQMPPDHWRTRTLADFQRILQIVAKCCPTLFGAKRGGKYQTIGFDLEIDGVTHVYVGIIGEKQRRLSSKTFFKRD